MGRAIQGSTAVKKCIYTPLFWGSKVMMKCTRGQMPVDTEFLRSTDDVRDNRLVNKVLVYRLKNLKLKILN